MDNDPDLRPFDKPLGKVPPKNTQVPPTSPDFTSAPLQPFPEPAARVQPPGQPTPGFEPPADPYSQLPSPVNDPSKLSGRIPKLPKRRRRGLKLAIMSLAVLLLLTGGAAAAYWNYYLPNKPNSVVSKAFSNFLAKDDAGSFALNVAVKGQGDSIATTTITVNGSMDTQNNLRFDSGVSFSAFKLTSSMIIRPDDKELYLRVNELPSLLQVFGGSASQALSDLADKLDKNWIKIDTASLEEAGMITSEQAAAANKCVDAYRDKWTSGRSTLISQIADAYDANKFISNAQKAGKESVSGQDTTKYSLSLDLSKAREFLKSDIVDSSQLEADCGTSSPSPSETDDVLDQATDDVKVENVYIWINNDKQIVKFSADIITSGATTQLDGTFDDKLLDTAKPANALTFKDLMQDYQNLLQGPGSQLIPGLDSAELLSI